MQQIATSKSNIAALGVPSEQEILPIPSRGEEFRQLLRDNDKQLGYASPVEPVGTSLEARHTKSQFDAPAEKQPVEANKLESADTGNEEDQEAVPHQQQSREANKTKNPDSDAEQVSQNASQGEGAADLDGADENSAVTDEESVDWLNLLQRANESHGKIEISPVVEEKPKKELGDIVSKLDVSVQNVVTELSLEQIQQDPLSNMLKEVSELPDIPESLAIELNKLLPKIEQGAGEINLDDLNDQELEALQQALAQWLMNQSGQQEQEQADTEPDLSMLLSLLNESSSEQEVDPQVSMFDLSEQEVKDLLAEALKNADIPADMKALLNAPENKLDSVLAKLAENMELAKKDGDKQVRLAGLEKHIEQASDVSAGEVKAEFIASLKVGLEEIKSQIKQGHQPALDLKALVNETINKMSRAELIADVPAEKLDQAMSSLTRTLDVANLLTAGQDVQAVQAANYERMVNRETSVQTTTEQSRQQQANVVNDKAINITKAEGHQQMAEKVRWMVNSNNLQADIRLDPPELGSVQVRVNVSGEAASVSFIVQSQQARDVLEQATPRLKELLEEQGIELGQSSVQQESDQQANGEEGQLAGNSHGHGEEPDDIGQGIEQRVVNGSLSGIDYYV